MSHNGQTYFENLAANANNHVIIMLLLLLFIYFSLALQIVHKIINYNMTINAKGKKYKSDYMVL